MWMEQQHTSARDAGEGYTKDQLEGHWGPHHEAGDWYMLHELSMMHLDDVSCAHPLGRL